MKFIKFIASLIYFSLLIYVLSCFNATDSKEDELIDNTTQQYSIYLTGKVLDQDGKPVIQAKAELKKHELSASTNVEGIYILKMTKAERNLNKSAALLEDSLNILKDGQMITRFEIYQYIDTLPDVCIVQRDVYGKIDKSLTDFKKIEAVIKTDVDELKIVDLWYNSSTFGFSGFVYFVYESEQQNYEVYVNVYDKDSNFTGRSQTIQFNSIAGNIEIPKIDPLNAFPIANAGLDTIVSINDSVFLHGTAIDSFNGEIVSSEWDIGNLGNFINISPEMNYTGIAPDTANSAFPCILRITDDDGNSSLDTVFVEVVWDLPMPSASTLTTKVAINDSIILKGSASDNFGKVVKWEWDVGNSGTFTDVSPDSNYTGIAPNTANKSFLCILRVTDDDGNIALDTIAVEIVKDTPIPLANTTTNKVSINDSVSLKGTAYDKYGKIVNWEWDIGNTGTFVDVSPDSNYKGTAPDTANSAFPCVLKVTDDDGNTALDTITINVVQDIPRIAFISNDTVVDYGGIVKCSVYVTQAFGTITFEIDTANSGNFKALVDNDTNATYSFSTDTASSWDSVKVKVTDDDGNVVYNGIKVDIRPRALSIISLDSTVNTITVNYTHSQERDFMEYRIYRHTSNEVANENYLWTSGKASGTLTYTSADESYDYTTYYYVLYQIDSEGIWSPPSNVMHTRIINSPPGTPSITFPSNDNDSMWSNDSLKWNQVTDLNGHPVKYRVIIVDSAGITINKELVTHLSDTTIELTGFDTFGIDITWKVLAYDNILDSSKWSTERTTILKKAFTDSRDNKRYKYVSIGAQIWMAENLNYTPASGNSWCYNDSSHYCYTYGRLYDWNTAIADTHGNGVDICPEGWHLPSDTEWTIFESVVGASSGKPLFDVLSKGSNAFRFSLLPAGYYSGGTFYNFGKKAYFWSSTEIDNSYAWSRDWSINDSSPPKDTGAKSEGFSIRCLED